MWVLGGRTAEPEDNSLQQGASTKGLRRTVRLSPAPIHRSAWKDHSPNSVCRIWDMRHPEDQGPRRSGLAAFRVDRHMSWRCIEMRLAAWCGRRGGPCLAGADPATGQAFPPRPLCAFLRPRSGRPGLRHPSGPFAASCGVCGAPSVRRSSAAAWRRGPGSPLPVWMGEDRYVPFEIQTDSA